jgi:hypothetical protein
MLTMKKLSKSTRKYIRTEKARIRKEVLDQKEQKKLIDELYSVRKPISQSSSKNNKSDNKKNNLSNKICPKVIKSPKIKEPVSETKNKSIKVSKNETDLPKEAKKNENKRNL